MSAIQDFRANSLPDIWSIVVICCHMTSDRSGELVIVQDDQTHGKPMQGHNLNLTKLPTVLGIFWS